MKKLFLILLFIILSERIFAQGTFSGDFMMNVNFFQRDSNIKAAGNPLYDNYLRGSEAWLNLRYNTKGFTFYLRGDAFNHSNLKNPTAANTDYGIGAWSVTKQIKELSITLGSIYDQVGSGILFRAYEDRGLLIDNALMGVQIKYKPAENLIIKGFSGQQKNNYGVNNLRYGPIIGGLNIEGDFSRKKVHVSPGIGVVARTLDANSMNQIVATINSQELNSRFVPMYNMYAISGYNTLTYKGLSWYVEGDYKTHEAIMGLDNLLHDKSGNVVYTSLSYGIKGIAINLCGKRTENFVMRTSPNEILLNGMLNRQPVIAVMRPERLMARYTPASRDISEIGGTANLVVSPNDVTNFTLTYSHINMLDNQELYREGYAEVYLQSFKSWNIHVGVQYLEYNTTLYQNRPARILYAITPFGEVTYRINEKRSIRGEVQYMNAKQDYGSWIFALLEYNVAPKWSLAVSDMYNTVPNKEIDHPNYTGPGFSPKSNHYYNIFAAYTLGANRFTLAYVKQVDGINCTGGVCRYEPAFSGVKLTIISSF